MRAILDQGGLSEIGIFASGGLDEDAVADLLRAGAPFTGFGLGTALTTSSDVAALDCAYKLQEYAGIARRKRSTGKATWPGRKQVWRSYGSDGRMSADALSLETEKQSGEPLLELVMRAGRRTVPAPTLAESRAHAASSLARLPDALRGLEPKLAYRVDVSDALERLAADVDRRLAAEGELGKPYA